MAEQVGFCGKRCGWAPDDSFECIQCHKRVCYCQGCGDDDLVLAEMCDGCWAVAMVKIDERIEASKPVADQLFEEIQESKVSNDE